MQDLKNIRLIDKIRRELGELVVSALEDPNVLEISLNPDGILFVERFGESMLEVGKIAPAQSEAAIKTIASFHSDTISRERPTISCELPIDGSRFEGLLPPVVHRPTFSIRKKASKIFSLDEYVKSKIMTTVQKEKIVEAVGKHQNIIVVGGTGSGKTTLTNGIILEIVRQFKHERIVIIEDTNEIQCSAENNVIMHSTKLTPMLTLLKSTMRLRPDRILVGEVRGGEAWTLLKAWNTGHPGGVVTVHADSANGAMLRLEQLSAEDVSAPRQTEYLKGVIAEAVNIVVFITKTKNGRKIQEMLEVVGLENNQYLTRSIGEHKNENNAKIKPIHVANAGNSSGTTAA